MNVPGQRGDLVTSRDHRYISTSIPNFIFYYSAGNNMTEK